MATLAFTDSDPAQLDALELGAWRGLLRTHAFLVKSLDGELESGHGLPLTSYEVLLFLDGADECRMRMCDLASSINLSRSGLTRLVDRLERDGLIRRVSCAHDARGAYATLTPDGQAKLAAARVTHLEAVRRHFLERFTPDELELLSGYWERVVPPCC